MSQTHIRTFLICSATFLALEAGPVVASLVVSQSAAANEQFQSRQTSEFPRAWMPGQLFDFSACHRTRRDCDEE
jgi:hypothetical protein